MALFDIFGGGPTKPATFDPAQYYTDARRDAANQSLMALGLGLLAQGGPQREPVGLGSAVGKSGLGALGAYNQGLGSAFRGTQAQALLAQHQRQTDQQKKYEGMFGEGGAFEKLDPASKALLSNMDADRGSQLGLNLMNKSPKDKFITVGDQLYDVSSGKPTLVSEAAGPFKGTSMDAQTFNVLIEGNPGSPEYAAAYARAAQPKVQFDQATGNWVSTNPDMSWARRPMRQAPAGVPSGGPAPSATPGPQGDATTIPIPGGGSVTTGTVGTTKMNDTQSTSALYADRMRESMKILDDPAITDAATSVMERGKAAIPGVGNFLVSKEYQKFEQAQRDFINAVLRRESGAVISDQEFANARKQYFPQPGDTPDVISQKKANRQNALEGISRAAGPGYKPKAGEAPKVLRYNPATGQIE